jgi:hypothetical protein
MFIPEQHRAYPNTATREFNIGPGSIQSAPQVKILGRKGAGEKEFEDLGRNKG